MTESERIANVLDGISEDLASGYLTVEKTAWLVKKVTEFQLGRITLPALNDYFNIPF